MDAQEDLKLKLSSLEEKLEGAWQRETALTSELETAKLKCVDAEDSFNCLRNNVKLWTERLVKAAKDLSAQLAAMKIEGHDFTTDRNTATSISLTNFFEGLLDVLREHQQGRAPAFTRESRKLAKDVLFKVPVKIVHRNPGVDISKFFKSLLKGTDTSGAEELVAPIADKIDQLS
jgi:hypothetical protein